MVLEDRPDLNDHDQLINLVARLWIFWKDPRLAISEECQAMLKCSQYPGQQPKKSVESDVFAKLIWKPAIEVNVYMEAYTRRKHEKH